MKPIVNVFQKGCSNSTADGTKANSLHSVRCFRKWKYLLCVHLISQLFFVLFSCPVIAGEPHRAEEIFNRMMTAMQQVKTASFVLDLHERIRNEMRHDRFIVKLNVNPYKVYVFSVTPNPGAEALYLEGHYNGKAFINPNIPLIPTLLLSPFHPILRKNHQYTLLHFGFQYVYEVCRGYQEKLGADFYRYLHRAEDVTFGKISCYQLILQPDTFQWLSYTVQKGENLVSIARKLLVNDHMILINNPKLKNYDDVREGQKILVPSAFGKKIVFYVDRLTFLPIVQMVYDDKGLYSRIEITSLVVNPPFTENDFSRHNKNYRF